MIVLSNDGFNEIATWRSVVVVPCSTSDKQRARGPTAVSLKRGAGGLRKGSVELCHQITTVDRDKLIARWGRWTVTSSLPSRMGFALRWTCNVT